ARHFSRKSSEEPAARFGKAGEVGLETLRVPLHSHHPSVRLALQSLYEAIVAPRRRSQSGADQVLHHRLVMAGIDRHRGEAENRTQPAVRGNGDGMPPRYQLAFSL